MRTFTVNVIFQDIYSKYIGGRYYLFRNRNNTFYLPEDLKLKNLKQDCQYKLQFTIGINTKNKGFWAYYPYHHLNLFRKHKDIEKGNDFESLCRCGINQCVKNFPFKLFKQPTKVGVKVL